MIDYKGYLFITSTYAGRLPLSIATISNVMTRVTGAHFAIQWLDAADPSYIEFMLGMVAKQTGNEISVGFCGPEMSVCNSKRPENFSKLANQYDATHFINLDDDLMVTEQSLKILRGLHNIPVVSIGVQDGSNARGFADYDETKYDSYLDFCLVHPPGKAKHHMFKHASVITGYKWISQLWCLDRVLYFDDFSIWDLVCTQFSEKGIRGYDIVLENELASAGYDINLIVGCEALHIGLEHGYIGGPWTGAAPITKTVVNLGHK